VVAGAAVAVAARAAVVAVDEGYRSGEAVADQRRRGPDADAGEAALARRDADIGRIEPGDLAEALIVRDAVDDEAVDGVEREPGVGERLGERPQAERIGVVFRQFAVARVPHADDRDGFLTVYGFAPDASGYIIASGSTNNPPLVIVRESGRSSNHRRSNRATTGPTGCPLSRACRAIDGARHGDPPRISAPHAREDHGGRAGGGAAARPRRAGGAPRLRRHLDRGFAVRAA